jgi:acetylornithine deacetylase
MTDTEKLLRELIVLPSVNPAFLPLNDARAGEGRVADFLAATAANAGLDIRFQKVLPGRSNLLATLSPTGKVKQRVLLAPHLDTVNAVSDKQFVPRFANGRIYGRGACDTKGSVAAMFTALGRLARQGRRPAATEIVFAWKNAIVFPMVARAVSAKLLPPRSGGLIIWIGGRRTERPA